MDNWLALNVMWLSFFVAETKVGENSSCPPISIRPDYSCIPLGAVRDLWIFLHKESVSLQNRQFLFRVSGKTKKKQLVFGRAEATCWEDCQDIVVARQMIPTKLNISATRCEILIFLPNSFNFINSRKKSIVQFATNSWNPPSL